jgi:hypothetical protein
VSDRRRAPALVALLALAALLAGCDYVVVPPEQGGAAGGEDRGWTAMATMIGPSEDGGTRVELTIRNETGDWSAMEAARSATLSSADGSRTDCPDVFVSTGGHRLAPGFQMRGYVAGPKSDPGTELIRVECPATSVAPGSRLAFEYSYVTGEYNYYDPDATRVETRLEVDLDQVAADVQYPVAAPIDGLVRPADATITAINDVLLTLAGRERTESGFAFTWRTSNPGEYPSYVHIGRPPVIGADGILYGFYESPDLESVPVTPAGEEAEWTTEVAVPAGTDGFYILLSVESKKQRLFVNYAIDVGGS